MKRRCSISYAVLQAALWGIYGFLFSFANRYLLDRGLSDLRIGLILGVATGLSFLLQPLLTAVTDRLPTFSCRRILALCAGLMSLCSAVLPAVPSVTLVIVLYASACVCLQVLPAFVNALGMRAIRGGVQLNFGLARGLGSIVFGIAAQVAIPLIDRFGLNAVPICSAAPGIAFIAAALAFPELRQTEQETETATPALTFVRSHGRFMSFLGGVVLMYIGHNVLTNCMFQIAEFKGDGDAQGTALLIAAAIELPTMFLFTKLLKLAKCEKWLCLSCVFFTLRLVLSLVLPGPVGLCVAQLAQMPGFALFTVSSVYYVGEVIDRRDVVKGQTYLAVSNTLGTLLAHFLGGFLIDTLGVGNMLLVCIGLSALGMVIVFATVGRRTKRS